MTVTRQAEIVRKTKETDIAVKVDLDGNQLTESPYKINPAGFTIHSAIHEVR